MKKFIQLGYDADNNAHHVSGVMSVKVQKESPVFGCVEYAPAGIIEIEVDDKTGQLIPFDHSPLESIATYGLQSRSDAWRKVVDELEKHNEDLMLGSGTGLQCVLRYINTLAEKAKKYDAIAQMLGS